MTAVPRFSIFRPVDNETNMLHEDTKNKRNKRFHLIHIGFKSKVFVPIIYWFKRKLGSHMVVKRSDIPDEPYNKNFQILYDTWEEAYKEWLIFFKCGGFISKIEEE